VNARKLITRLAVFSICLTISPLAFAHRVDEYLQATRLSIDLDRVDVEINLTPGIDLANTIFASIDTNRDGEISSAEGEAYARQMLRSVVLKADGSPAPITLVETSFPQFSEMKLGVGMIRLRATAKIPAAASGRHEISYLNTHRPESSVYLVNALVPTSPRIQISDQRRDVAQHGLTLDYLVATSTTSQSDRAFAVLVGFVMAGSLFLRCVYGRRPVVEAGLAR
jgi:hypothetical protein